MSDAALAALEEENRRLRRAVEELSILNDLARAIGASLDPQEIMGTVVRRSLRAVKAEQGVINLLEMQPTSPLRTLIREAAVSSAHESFRPDQALVGWMHLNKKPLMVNTPGDDSRFRGVAWDPSISSLLCAPMLVKGELRGIVTVYNKKAGENFTEDDLRLLAIIAAQSAQIIENARLNENERQFLKMKEEMRLAAQIQSDLLPQSAPGLEGYDLAGRNIPAQVVGGDHFDFVAAGGGRMGICLGDVSGKGLPAALLMSNLQATLRSQITVDAAPEGVVRRSNQLLFQSTSPEKFATLYYCLLDPPAGRVLSCNAGQCYPVLMQADGTLRELEEGGPPLAMLEDFPFTAEEVALGSGDALIMYSDGVSEAVNPHNEQYGVERLLRRLAGARGESAAGIVDAVVTDVRTFCGAAAQSDDITLVVLRRL